ncbi:hypothetical protein BRADI_4g04950v3, partial [Brachypodium distachyon]
SQVQPPTDPGEEVRFRDSFDKAAEVFGLNFKFHAVETKIHRFPEGLRGLGDRYIVPMAVAIGPYHHGCRRLMEMEKVKDAAAHHFIEHTGSTFEVIWETFYNDTVQARRYYAEPVMQSISDAAFVRMMFCDACFLLQYMLSIPSSHTSPTPSSHTSPTPSKHLHKVDESLRNLFVSNRASIENDIMLLENQLPWTVLKALMKLWHVHEVDVDEFIVKMGAKFDILSKHNHMLSNTRSASVADHHRYSPPHLLGLLRSHKIAASKEADGDSQVEPMKMSVPIGASQLEINGIKLTASKSAEFNGVELTKGFFYDKFSLAPLSLDRTTACWLVNMAAFEVWTAASFSEGSEKTAVSSYLALLAMLTDREEDVHKLRKDRLVRTELTDKQTLEFFDKIVEHISPGRCYIKILADMDECKRKRCVRISVHKFVSRNSKAIVTVLTIIGVLVGIFKTLFTLMQPRQIS